MHILLLTDSLQTYPECIHSGYAHIISALLHGNHQISILYSGNSIDNPSWLQKTSTYYMTDDSDSQNYSLKSILKPIFRPQKHYLKKINLWKQNICSLLEKQQKLDLIFVLPGNNSNIINYALSEIPTNIPWIGDASSNWDTLLKEKHFYHYNKKLKYNISNIINKAAFLTCPSMRLYERLQKCIPSLKQKLLYIPFPNSNIEGLHLAPNDTNIKFPPSTFTLLYPGNLNNGIFQHRFLNAFSRFVKQSCEGKNHIKLLLAGNIDSKTIKRIKNYGLKSNIYIINVSYYKLLELFQKVSALLHIEENNNDAILLPHYLPAYIASGRTIIALTQYHSETKRLLKNNNTIYANSTDEDDIYCSFVRAWSEWQNEESNKHYPESLTYLISEQNFNNVIDIALRCSINTNVSIKQ